MKKQNKTILKNFFVILVVSPFLLSLSLRENKRKVSKLEANEISYIINQYYEKTINNEKSKDLETLFKRNELNISFIDWNLFSQGEQEDISVLILNYDDFLDEWPLIQNKLGDYEKREIRECFFYPAILDYPIDNIFFVTVYVTYEKINTIETFFIDKDSMKIYEIKIDTIKVIK